MKDHFSKFKPGHFYHVYNRANGNENLFRETKNYPFFLKKWDKYLNGWVEVWAYCLMPNHFHFLVKILDSNTKDLKGFKTFSGLISNQFSKLFNSYSKSFNKVYERHGSLFQKPFKHIHVDTQNYLLTLIHYIHHKFAKDFTDWEYSSYSAIIGKGKTTIKKSKVLNFLGGREKLIEFHHQMKNYKNIEHLTIE